MIRSPSVARRGRVMRSPRGFVRPPSLSNVGKPLLQVDGLVMPSLVELCTPHPVHALVVGPAEDYGRAETNVEVAQIFQSHDQSFGLELRAIALQRCD